MNPSCCGVILAGGLARRMGGQPKHQLSLAGSTLLDRVIERAAPQVNQLLINANPPISQELAKQRLPYPIIEDSLPGHLGPLAGILSALEWMNKHSDHRWLASFAVDSPLLPKDLVSSLMATALDDSGAPSSSQLICPTYAGHKQPTFCLWHVDQRESLKRWLVDEQNYRMGAWLKQQNARYYDFSTEGRSAEQIDPFTNINTPEELIQLEQSLSSQAPK